MTERKFDYKQFENPKSTISPARRILNEIDKLEVGDVLVIGEFENIRNLRDVASQLTGLSGSLVFETTLGKRYFKRQENEVELTYRIERVRWM